MNNKPQIPVGEVVWVRDHPAGFAVVTAHRERKTWQGKSHNPPRWDYTVVSICGETFSPLITKPSRRKPRNIYVHNAIPAAEWFERREAETQLAQEMASEEAKLI